MASQFTLPRQVKVNPSGRPYAGALVYFYAAGGTAPQPVYQDSSLTTPHSQPVAADDDGYLPVIWLNPDAPADYRVMVRTSAGVLLDDIDNVPKNPVTLTRTLIGSTLFPRTLAEIGDSIVPSDTGYPDTDERRYGAPALNLYDYKEDNGDFNLMGFVPQSKKSAIRDHTSTADVSAYMQDALDAVVDERVNGGCLRLPMGRMYIESQVNGRTGVSIRGSSYMGSDVFVVGNIVGFQYLPTVYTEAGFTLADFSIRGTDEDINDDLIQLGSGSWAHFERLRLRNTNGSCIKIITGGGLNEFLHLGLHSCIFETFGQYAIEVAALASLLNVHRAQVNSNDKAGTAFIGFDAGAGQVTLDTVNVNGANLLTNVVRVNNANIGQFRMKGGYAEFVVGPIIKAAGTGIIAQLDASACNWSTADSVDVDLSGAVAHNAIHLHHISSQRASGTFFVPGSTSDYDVHDIAINGGTRVQGYTGAYSVRKYPGGPTVVDGKATLQSGTQVTSGATVDVSAQDIVDFAHSGATTVTGFTNARTNQVVFCKFNNGNTTIQHGSNFRLQGGVNFVGTSNDTLTLVHVGSNVFWEQGRSVNG